MRGKDKLPCGQYSCWGITPAHAGKSFVWADFEGSQEDHPRPCGEKCSLDIQNISRIGSPPPMRGKADAMTFEDTAHGITPAHAGKSGSHRDSGAKRQDHPRPCGEKCVKIWFASLMRDHPRPCGEKKSALRNGMPYPGSPPPMRGKVSCSM